MLDAIGTGEQLTMPKAAEVPEVGVADLSRIQTSGFHRARRGPRFAILAAIIDSGEAHHPGRLEGRSVYSVQRVETSETIGPARSLDHALMLTDATGPGRYEVLVIGDLSKHLCFITRNDDGTFVVDPRQAGGLTAALGSTLTRA